MDCWQGCSLLALELERDAVDAVALVGRGWEALALEHVPQVAPAVGAAAVQGAQAGRRGRVRLARAAPLLPCQTHSPTDTPRRPSCLESSALLLWL